MTPEQHNKYLSWAHLGYAAISGVLMLLMLGFMTVMMRFDGSPPPPGFIVFIWLFVGFMFALTIGPSLIAAYGMLSVDAVAVNPAGS